MTAVTLPAATVSESALCNLRYGANMLATQHDGVLEPVTVFRELSNKISATKTLFRDYSAGVSKLLKLKVPQIIASAVSGFQQPQ